jgi:hypothetical protein
MSGKASIPHGAASRASAGPRTTTQNPVERCLGEPEPDARSRHLRQTSAWSRPGSGGFAPGKPFINRGIGGQTTPQMLIRFRADVIALRPRVVVILAGTNDIAGNTGPTRLADIQDNLATMADLARAHGIRVVLLAPRREFIRDSLEWLDATLGPVRR